MSSDLGIGNDGFTVVSTKKTKNETVYVYSDSDSDSDTNVDKLKELEHCIKVLDKMDEHIRNLWDEVIVPYLENYNERQILDQLTVNDYDKFYGYMTSNNEVYKHVAFMINYLQD